MDYERDVADYSTRKFTEDEREQLRKAERKRRIAELKRRKRRQEKIRKTIFIGVPAVALIIVVYLICDNLFGLGISSYRARKKAEELAAQEEYDRQMAEIRALPTAAGLDVVTGHNMTEDENAQFLQPGESGAASLASADGEELGDIETDNLAGVLGGDGQDSNTVSPFMSGYSSSAEAFEAHKTAKTSGMSGEVISEYGVLMDAETGEIVAQRNANTRISPASMTKVLTILVAAENLPDPDLEKTVPITIEVTDFSYRNDCSNVGFARDEVVTIRDLFYGTILPSGGDAAYALSCYVAGSMEAFADLMNEKLADLGLSGSAHFTNSVGLYDDDHYCTIYDMAIIMDAAMRNSFCREVLSAHTYTTSITPEHPEGITISNWFLRRIEDKDCGGLVVGAKTGFVVQSRNCAVSYATDASGHPYICATGASTSGWKCIYDHVRIYKAFFSEGGFDPASIGNSPITDSGDGLEGAPASQTQEGDAASETDGGEENGGEDEAQG
ncbi:MAG: D-alanyl-D-alanine carboxypeptidase [Lachnospiraceae bacterium]|nr:D-alanyl-D-alanine carboxypeptidase [Lachnospiraceae bacterium]